MSENLSIILQIPVLFYLILLLVGLCVGSFLNVVIHRLPQMMLREWRQECTAFLIDETNHGDKFPKPCPTCQHTLTSPLVPVEADEKTYNLVVPHSACPHCKHSIGVLENIPLLSFVLQKGCCKHCKAPISKRYPLVELITGLVTCFLGWHFGPNSQFLASCFFAYLLIAMTFIDLDHQFLPDITTYIGLWIGILLNYRGLFVPLTEAILGVVIGYLSLWSVYQLFKILTGKEGMGYGDFKLMAMLGAWLGWKLLPFIILCSSLLGSLMGIILMIKAKNKSLPFAFGPYLAIAGFMGLLYGQELTLWYIRLSIPAQ